MQKYFRAEIRHPDGVERRRLFFAEACNPYFGYFFTAKKTLVKKRTRYQELQLVDTDEFGKVLLLDNIIQVAEKNDFHYHEPMVHPALCSHPHPQSVLVIGAGDGGVLREVLKYPCVRRIDLAELDTEVIAFSKKYLFRVNGGAFRDPRVHVHITDGRCFTKDHPHTYDIIIMDMTDPLGPSTLLYTREFFRLVKKAFKNRDSLFVMHSESPISQPKAFACIQKTLRSVFNSVLPLYTYVQMYGVLWSVTLCASHAYAAQIKAARLNRKLARYGIRNLKLYTGSTHHAMQCPFPYIQRLLRSPARIITDANPAFPNEF
ncbi:MAG: polyamine aminopropyltransferase [Chitinispirillaceae bacterium]|nr:polyamine aminopropyltransferase [Chitinispirillaceae bacterium]